MTLFERAVAVFAAAWTVLREGSPYLLAGLVLAGLLHEFVDTRRIAAAMGRRGWRSILIATMFGAPLPLCSCGVLPAAVSLRRKGASRGATLAFMVSTPETGVDSLSLTWGLLGPFFTVVRAAVGMIVGLAVGMVVMLRGGPEKDLDSFGAEAAHDENTADEEQSIGRRFRRALRYGFVDLFGDLALWLLVGFLASGLVKALLPEQFFAGVLGAEWVSFLAMAAFGALTYVCASASTPLAAAMVAGGLNPGAALVFLLTGPATNAATVLVVGRLFGKRVVAIYLGTVVATSFAAGFVLNRIVPIGSVAPGQASSVSALRGLVESASAIVVLALAAFVLRRNGVRREVGELIGGGRAAIRALRGIRWRRIVRRAAWCAAAGALAWWLSTSLYRVRPGQRAIVRLFGRLEPMEIPPGLHVAVPPPFGRIDIVAVDAIRTAEIGFRAPPLAAVGDSSRPPVFPPASPSFSNEIPRLPFESQFVTGDENVIEVTAVVQYRILDAARFRVGSERGESIVAPIARALLLEEIGRLPVDAIYSSARGAVETETLARLHDALARIGSGLEPLGVRLLYVHAPDDVHPAFRDVASSAEDSLTSRNLALAESERSVRDARAEAGRLVLEAEAARIEMVERAKGATGSFVAIRQEYLHAPESTRLRLYLETVERALAPLNKWIRPAGGRGLELWISRDARPAAAPAAPPDGDSFTFSTPPPPIEVAPPIPTVPPNSPQ